MRLPSFALLALTSVGLSGATNLTLFGAPRASLDPVLPVLSIEESYIILQTDGISDTAFGAADALQCSVFNPCADGSCCNSQGHCGYRDEHCKVDCVANCDAKAPCGINSKDGKQKCPLNLCCSHLGFCGASDAFCRDVTESGISTPCQKDFGTCGTVSTKSTTPSCGKGSGTASRRVAYYEGWNTRRRPCDKVWPADIDTTGLTHLIFSFATIDPTTFAVMPMHPDDEKLYADFLDLKDGSQKWIGIGGWEFSDTGATRYTWTQMASSKANREAFIVSLLQFLSKWNFGGVDIDWEWPGAETRGGNPAIDKANQVSLMKELREALGSRGLSAVMPAQYEYLKNIDPKAIEAEVDFYNVLAYDLHGPWDGNIPSLGPKVRPHTDLKEIDTALELFWSDNVTPAKINLGLANYGRGYLLADPKCAKYDCVWTGPSKAGECTELAGVFSQCEINRIIASKNLKPEIIAGGAGVKQIIFDGQWVGYDDNETLGMKQELANNRCLGGTALWAIDYASCGRDSDPGVPGAFQSSSAAPSSVASSKPAASSPPGPASPTTSRVQSSAPISLSGSLTAPSASVPAQSSQAVTSNPAPGPSSSSQIQSSAATSTPGPSTPASSGPASSAESATNSQTGSSTASGLVSSAQSSQAASSKPVSTSSAVQASSSVVSSSQAASSSTLPVVIVPSLGSSRSSGVVGTSGLSSAVTSSSIMASQQTSSSRPSSDSFTATSLPASSSQPVVSGSSSAGQSASSSILGASNTSVATSPAASASSIPSSTTVVVTTSLSTPGVTTSGSGSSSIRTSVTTSPVQDSSQLTSGTTSQDTSSSVPSSQSVSTTGALSQSASQSSGSTSLDVSSSPASSATASRTSSVDGSSKIMSSSVQTSSGVVVSSIAQISPTSRQSSVVASSGTPGGSNIITSSPVPTSNASKTQAETEELTTTDDEGNTVVVPPLMTKPGDDKPTITTTEPDENPDPNHTQSPNTGPNSTPAASRTQGTKTFTASGAVSATPIPTGALISICPKCPEFTWCSLWANKLVKDLPLFPPPECVDNPWCLECWPKPSEYLPELCPPQCWFLDWCRPLCAPPDMHPDVIPPPGIELPWFTAWWWKLPVRGCVPNDCVADCVPWFAITLITLKKPVCPCVPKTCSRGEKEKNDKDKKCQLLGCGCGWMGLPFGPGCDIDINLDLPNLFPGGLFGPQPCWFFGSCPPGVGPGPGPGGEQGDCGPLGCDGYCNTPGGCDPCPKEICGGPQCPIATGCGPKPGPNPKPNTKRPPKCDEDKKTTVTEKLVHCTESIQLEPTTIQSINFTLSTTVTSTCWTPLLATYTGCGILGTSTTTTLSKFTTTSSSEAPMCTRAPLDLNNDEGDNEQPPRTTDGPSCTRAPLSLDDDEGDNEHPTSSEGPSCTRAPLSLDDDEGDNEQSTSSEAPQCTRAPLSLDDDEGNNEMPDEMLSSLSLSFSVTPRPTPSANSSLSFTPTPTSDSSDVTSSVSRVPPPSTLSESFTGFPWGTGIPSGTPVAQCSGCDKEFKRLVQLFCPDGENVDACAKWALTGLCYGSESPDYCKTGSCKPAACPKENPGNFEKGEPAIPWTTTLSLASTTITVTATPTSVSLPIGPTPTCNPGHGVSPDGKWTILVEHEIKERPDNATFTWKLWDENGCYADQGAASNQIHGHNITTDIGAWSRKDYKMGYSLHTYVTESLSTSRSEVEFVISKPVDGCKSDCWTKWKIANPQESKPFQIHSDCAPECGMRKLDTSDISCDDGINKFHDNGVGSVQKRGGYCTFRMPFQPKDDSAPPPLKPFTRDSRWTLEIRQWMEYEKSEIEWSIKDPHGISAGNDLWDTSNANPYSGVVDTRGRDDTPENNIRYKMKLTVDEPRTKEKSTVQLEYLSWDQFDGCSYNTNVVGEMAGCRPIYRTETSDEKQQSSFNGCFGLNPFTNKKTACPKAMLSNAEFTCEMVADSFYPKGAGFERKFKCFWPHDFVDPWDGLPRPDDNQLMLVDERKKKFGEKYRGAYWIASVMGTDGGMNGTVASAGVDGKVNESSWTNV